MQQDDVKKLIYGVLIVFIAVVVTWVSYVIVTGCGFSLDCKKAAIIPERTPIPTLIPASMPLPVAVNEAPKVACQITTVDLLGAWVSAGYPEKDPFSFTDINGANCTATYPEDITPLFQEGNLWYSGAPPCTTCHNSTLNQATAGMDLSSYQGILAGSRRTSADVTGNDILGGGVWENSKLYTMLFVKKLMPQGRPADVPAKGPVIFAGTQN